MTRQPRALDRAQHNPLNPELTEKWLSAFEATLPAPLPDDFRSVLLRYNGAKLGPCAAGFKDARGREVTLRELLGLHDGGWLKLTYPEDDVPEGLLVFAAATSSALNCFALQLVDGPRAPRGTVWFLDADAEVDPESSDLFVPRVVAPAFTAFLDSLEPLPEEPLPVPLDQDPTSPWSNPDALEKVPADAPTNDKPLVLAGHGHAVQKARLTIHLTASSQDPDTYEYRYDPDRAKVSYGLEIAVDDRSGEDGMPAPEAQSIPIAESRGGKHPTLVEWSSLVVESSDAWDAWYGNDAPELTQNRLEVLARDGDKLRLRWSAKYWQYGRAFDFLFEGLADFGPARVAVKEREDLPRVLASAFGGALGVDDFEVKFGKRTDYGAELAAEDRYWIPVLLTPK